MSFIDTIKNSVLEEFSGTLSVGGLVLSLVVAFLIAIYIIFIYKKTFAGVVYSKNFALTVTLLSMVTALIIRTINSNLALSLGMVGALSIVRFRTAVKEPMDTAFMFWGISAGIMAGAGLYLAALVASLALGLLFYICYLFGFKPGSKYLLIIKVENKNLVGVEDYLKKIKNKKLKSKSILNNVTEMTYEYTNKNEDTKLVNSIYNLDGVLNVSLVSYQNDFGE